MRQLILVLSAFAIFLGGVFSIKALNFVPKGNLLGANVEALADGETKPLHDQKAAEWIVHRWENGDYNCAPGGKEKCVED